MRRCPSQLAFAWFVPSITHIHSYVRRGKNEQACSLVGLGRSDPQQPFVNFARAPTSYGTTSTTANTSTLTAAVCTTIVSTACGLLLRRTAVCVRIYSVCRIQRTTYNSSSHFFHFCLFWRNRSRGGGGVRLGLVGEGVNLFPDTYKVPYWCNAGKCILWCAAVRDR